MSLSLSSILKVCVSTYENPRMDDVVDQMEYDLDDYAKTIKNIGGVKEYKVIQVKDIGLVDINDIECDDGFDFDNFKKDLGKNMQEALELCIFDNDLDTIFRKYGLEYTGMSFYTPKYYNYESDSLDIHLKTMRDEYDLEKLGLTDLIMEYIKNERQESYDGYCSFEPTRLDEVGIDDYCTIWAILKKEGVYDDMKEALQNFIDEGFSDELWSNCNPVYEVKIPNGKTMVVCGGDVITDYDLKKYQLDIDNKILIPIE